MNLWVIAGAMILVGLALALRDRGTGGYLNLPSWRLHVGVGLVFGALVLTLGYLLGRYA